MVCKDLTIFLIPQATIEDIEQAFWDVVEAGEEPTEVMYGADLDTSVMGSAFHVRGDRSSTPLDHVDRVYAESPWNLNNLPSLEDSLLKHLEDSIAGVTLPWMYMGMMFSSFCWHIEDHMFYSSKLSLDPKKHITLSLLVGQLHCMIQIESYCLYSLCREKPSKMISSCS